jgi:hypothetical protein
VPTHSIGHIAERVWKYEVIKGKERLIPYAPITRLLTQNKGIKTYELTLVGNANHFE